MSIERSTKILGGIFTASGVVHLVRPEVYEPIMPAWVPAHREVILGSGVAEIALAAGLLAPRTRRLAGWGSVALLAAVYPANVKMAADAAARGNKPLAAAAVARLPLQWPMVRSAPQAARG